MGNRQNTAEPHVAVFLGLHGLLSELDSPCRSQPSRDLDPIMLFNKRKEVHTRHNQGSGWSHIPKKDVPLRKHPERGFRAENIDCRMIIEPCGWYNPGLSSPCMWLAKDQVDRERDISYLIIIFIAPAVPSINILFSYSQQVTSQSLSFLYTNNSPYDLSQRADSLRHRCRARKRSVNC
jgi:hypothetical protein